MMIIINVLFFCYKHEFLVIVECVSSGETIKPVWIFTLLLHTTLQGEGKQLKHKKWYQQRYHLVRVIPVNVLDFFLILL